jgi:hypothetical protein
MYVPRQVIQLLGFGANSWLRQGGKLPINLGFRMHPSSGSKTTQTATTNNLEPAYYIFYVYLDAHSSIYIISISTIQSYLSRSFYVDQIILMTVAQSKGQDGNRAIFNPNDVNFCWSNSNRICIPSGQLNIQHGNWKSFLIDLQYINTCF